VWGGWVWSGVLCVLFGGGFWCGVGVGVGLGGGGWRGVEYVYIFHTPTLYTHLEITLPLTSWILSHGRCWLQLHHHEWPGKGDHKVQLRTRTWTNVYVL